MRVVVNDTEHPLYPLAQTALDTNMDGMNVHGRTRDIVMVGRGNSTLDELVADLAREQGRTEEEQNMCPAQHLNPILKT